MSVYILDFFARLNNSFVVVNLSYDTVEWLFFLTMQFSNLWIYFCRIQKSPLSNLHLASPQ